MAKSSNQKGKLLTLLNILKKKTDMKHRLSTPDLISELEKYDITAERKSIYADIACLIDMDYDIECDKSKNGGYYLASRDIEKYELLLLVDAVSSSRFITEKKSRELIKKLENLLSEYEAKELDREVYVSNRIKSDNESIYYMLDSIHEALINKNKIEFVYCDWNINKELTPRHDGRLYEVDPLSLTWDDEKYYLIAYDVEKQEIRHYRVDKMKNIKVSDKKVTDCDTVRGFDVVSYCNRTFGMYGGTEEYVTLDFPGSLAGVCIDRFGKEPTFRKNSDGSRFTVRVNVAVSNQFFGWVTGLGDDVRIAGPEYVVTRYKDFLDNISRNYKS